MNTVSFSFKIIDVDHFKSLLNLLQYCFCFMFSVFFFFCPETYEICSMTSD